MVKSKKTVITVCIVIFVLLMCFFIWICSVISHKYEHAVKEYEDFLKGRQIRIVRQFFDEQEKEGFILEEYGYRSEFLGSKSEWEGKSSNEDEVYWLNFRGSGTPYASINTKEKIVRISVGYGGLRDRDDIRNLLSEIVEMIKEEQDGF